ncbi:MAG TPA: hypothetical protein VG795_09105 [Acidimicrobiia bacterium]|nr:hypothetical protein [Acidimicrobiia bacterium]
MTAALAVFLAAGAFSAIAVLPLPRRFPAVFVARLVAAFAFMSARVAATAAP